MFVLFVLIKDYSCTLASFMDRVFSIVHFVDSVTLLLFTKQNFYQTGTHPYITVSKLCAVLCFCLLLCLENITKV